MTLYQAIERPLRPSHGKEGVSGSSPDVGLQGQGKPRPDARELRGAR